MWSVEIPEFNGALNGNIIKWRIFIDGDVSYVGMDQVTCESSFFWGGWSELFWCEHTGTIVLIHTHVGVLSCSDRTCLFVQLAVWFGFVCLFVYLFVCLLFVGLLVCWFVGLLVCLFVCLFVSLVNG